MRGDEILHPKEVSVLEESYSVVLLPRAASYAHDGYNPPSGHPRVLFVN